jgi:hypothetical protein
MATNGTDMNTDEILMRVGINAQGVVNGMGKITGFMKAQTELLMEDLQGMAGRWLGVLGVEKMFESLHERVTAIKHAADSTGLSVELIQGIFNKLNEEGIDYEKVIRPLSQLAGLTGDSKKFLGDLAEAYVHLNTQEERNAMLMNLGIKNWQSLIPILEEGRAGIEKMSEPNMFKLSDLEVKDITTMWEGMKGGLNGILGLAAKVVAVVGAIPRNIAAVAYSIVHGEPLEQVQKRAEAADERSEYAKAEAAAEAEGFTLAQKRAEIEEGINKLMEQRAHLQEQISDRDKLGVNELAERARKLLGLQKTPRGLESIYSVTPAMSAALQIQTLEDQAKVAQAMGNGAAADRLQSRADAIRAQRPELKRNERYPIEKTQEQIENINKQVDFMSAKLKKIPNIV